MLQDSVYQYFLRTSASIFLTGSGQWFSCYVFAWFCCQGNTSFPQRMSWACEASDHIISVNPHINLAVWALILAPLIRCGNGDSSINLPVVSYPVKRQSQDWNPDIPHSWLHALNNHDKLTPMGWLTNSHINQRLTRSMVGSIYPNQILWPGHKVLVPCLNFTSF